jgi:hypothetical protein
MVYLIGYQLINNHEAESQQEKETHCHSEFVDHGSASLRPWGAVVAWLGFDCHITPNYGA